MRKQAGGTTGRAKAVVILMLGGFTICAVCVSAWMAATVAQDAQPTRSATTAANRDELPQTAAHEDFPAAAVANDGSVWCAYVAYEAGTPVDQRETNAGRFESLQTRGHGDQVRLLRYKDGKWSEPLNVTEKGLDVWRPSMTVDGRGTMWIFWSQQLDGNWDVYSRNFDVRQGKFGETHQLTISEGPDINVVPTTSGDDVWLAWQARGDRYFEIKYAKFRAGELGSITGASSRTANSWNPAITATPAGEVWLAWDTYEKGDYDAYARCISKDAEPVPIATSSRCEARASIAADSQNRVWIAYEDGDVHWGKDHGPRLTGKGFPLYYERNIRVRCLENGQLKETKTQPRSELVFTHYDDTRYESEFKHRISQPRLGVDGGGNLWLTYRRHPNPQNVRGEHWVSFARYLDGDEWSAEVLLENSDNLLDNRPALAAIGGNERKLLAVYSTDGRDSGAKSAKNCDLNSQVLTAAAEVQLPELIDVKPDDSGIVEPVDLHEAENVKRCREYRIEAGGKTYRLLRGEFHRHTEISAHRDWDGPLEDVWRYALDAASMDWIGPGDHDYGFGHEYMWWLTQKQTDLYHDPGRFLAMYTYERSAPYPSGHRNVMFAERGIRPLPQMQGRQQKFGTPEAGSPDIKNLYRYLKQFGGICSSHTSATNMGTDWRDADEEVEPVVEIFQGHRQNYEETKAPLAARGPEDTIQGYRPAGFVWEAFKKGRKLGFQSSSDHVSTHTSYAFALAEEPTRQGIIDAFKKRHSYAANDNILLDVRSGEYIMGDEFETDKPPVLSVKCVGTAAIRRVDIIRQREGEMPDYVYNTAPGKAEIEFTWTDMAAKPDGTYMYYVRIQQEDERLAWASPMWVRYQP